LARTTSFDYDNQGRLWRTTLPAGSILTNYYDVSGRLVVLQDPFGYVTNVYDNLNRVVARYGAAGLVLSNRFDAGQRLTTEVQVGLWTNSFAYLPAGDLKHLDDGRGNRTEWRYDALGRLTNMVDAVGTTTYSYTLGTGGTEVVTEDGPWASDTVTVTNRHGLRSHLVVGQPAGSFATAYGWDAARRMTNVTAGGHGFGYTYLGAGGQIARVSLPGGYTITNTFDSVGRHTSTALRTSGGTNLNLHGYVYDAADRRTRISRTNSANTSWNGYASFGYDAAGQLVRAQTTNAAGSEVTSERFGYVYDASQNLRWRTNNTSVTGFTNNALNQLTSLNSTTRTHDRRGNLLANVQSGETLLYSWDDESQLTSVRVDPASSPAFQPWRIDFVYDGLRRLRRTLQFAWNGSAWTSQGEIRYLYDGMLIVQERNSSNTPQVHYSRGLDLSGTIHGAGGIGGLLMRSHGYSAGNWSSHNTYHSDANGNVTALVNSSGVLQASYKYNPYGGLISSSGALASANTMRFSSKPAIFSSSGAWGFFYYGYRFYDPVNQRWLNRDPIEERGGISMYRFSQSAPLDWLDPHGLQGWNDIWDNPVTNFVTAVETVNFTAGMADTLSLGLTGYARKGYGIEDAVDRCSDHYNYGEWAGAGLSVAMGGAGAVKGALRMGGRTGSMMARLLRGGGRFFRDPRQFSTVSDQYWRNVGANGNHLHHWLFPQRSPLASNAGFNLLELPGAVNSYMNGVGFLPQAAEWGIRLAIPAGVMGGLGLGVSRGMERMEREDGCE
jgi:RHS repeat-associated protein